MSWPLPFFGAGFEPAPVGTPGCAAGADDGFKSTTGGKTGANDDGKFPEKLEKAGAGGAEVGSGGAGARAGASSLLGAARYIKKIMMNSCSNRVISFNYEK